MRILQICTAKTIGGGERHVADLSHQLQTRGHSVFAALTKDSPLRNVLDLPPENFKISRMRNALDVFNARLLAQFVREKKIEIIHAHIARDYLPAAICSQLSGKPFVLTRHVLFPMKKANRFFLRRASGVIAVSKAVSRALSESGVFPDNKIKVIYNGIDIRRFSPLPGKAYESKIFRVGIIGEFSPLKRHEIILAAAERVMRKKSDVEFEFVGEDKTKKKETLKEIERIIKEFNLSSAVKLSGWRDDVVPFLHSLDAFVSASRFDAFGLVIAEAMACSLPVIAADAPISREIIEHDKNGILFPTDDADALAEAILDLLENPAKRERLGIAARKRIETQFSLMKMADETIEFYQDILRKSQTV
jgi:glycosyltransferase involved in cell wall biosynthesis